MPLRPFALLCAAVISGCTSTVDQDEGDLPTRGSLHGPQVTITYNPVTDIFVVEPVGGERWRLVSNALYDAGSFDLSLSEDASDGIMAYATRDGASVAVIQLRANDPDAIIIAFARPENTTIPTSGTVIYQGDYYGLYYIDGELAGPVTGDVSLDVSFSANSTIAGEITNRGLYKFNLTLKYADLADVTLELNSLGSDGRVALDDVTPPTVTAANSTILIDTFQLVYGRYDGMVAGPDGAHFVGGVEMSSIETSGGSATASSEFGAFVTSR